MSSPEREDQFDFALPYSGILAGVLGIATSEVLSKDPGAHHLLPEPFDYFSHSANLSVSAVTSALISAAVAFGVAEKRGWSLRKTRSIGALSGMAVVTVLNAISETKLGASLFPFPTTPDSIDFAYGIVGGAAGLGLANVKEAQPAAIE